MLFRQSLYHLYCSPGRRKHAVTIAVRTLCMWLCLIKLHITLLMICTYHSYLISHTSVCYFLHYHCHHLSFLCSTPCSKLIFSTNPFLHFHPLDCLFSQACHVLTLVLSARAKLASGQLLSAHYVIAHHHHHHHHHQIIFLPFIPYQH